MEIKITKPGLWLDGKKTKVGQTLEIEEALHKQARKNGLYKRYEVLKADVKTR